MLPHFHNLKIRHTYYPILSYPLVEFKNENRFGTIEYFVCMTSVTMLQNDIYNSPVRIFKTIRFSTRKKNFFSRITVILHTHIHTALRQLKFPYLGELFWGFYCYLDFSIGISVTRDKNHIFNLGGIKEFLFLNIGPICTLLCCGGKFFNYFLYTILRFCREKLISDFFSSEKLDPCNSTFQCTTKNVIFLLYH